MKLGHKLALLRERIQQRVEGQAPGLPDFRTPELKALEEKHQDAENWANAVGTVNPRRGRLHDKVIQAVKHVIGRSLRWHTYPQREFNRAILDALAETQRLFAEQNRALSLLAQAASQASDLGYQALEQLQALEGRVAGWKAELESVLREREQALDGRIISNVARLDSERAALAGEQAALASVQATLASEQAALAADHATFAREAREKLASLDYHLVANVKHLSENIAKSTERLSEALTALEQRIWGGEGEGLLQQQYRLLENELRLVRQRLLRAAPGEAQIAADRAAPGEAQIAADRPAPGEARPHAPEQVPGARLAGDPWAAAALPAFDYAHFEEHFRGAEREIREKQAIYLHHFRGRGPVLDVACGRGEFLRLLREEGIEARGVDVNPDMVAHCRDLGLEVQCADAFAYLESLPGGSLGGVFSSQFIEHLPVGGYARLIQLAWQKLRPGGALLLETQNPECLAMWSQHFFVDPTHVRPIAAAQARFWMQEAGFREIRTHYVSPVAPRLPTLPLFEDQPAGSEFERWNRKAELFNQAYFGYQDYAVVGVKP